MATLATLVVKLAADAGDFQRGLNNAEKSASGFVSSVTARFRQVGAIAVSGLGAAAGAVSGLGVALGNLAVDAAPLEGIRGAFEGIAESAGRSADEMLAALQEGSYGMISQRDLMLSFNRAAQLVGEDFAVQLPGAMQYLAKVSAATGQDMGYMLDSLVVGVSPMILDNLGIQVSLSQATERAAEMYGVQASELSKAQVQAGMMSVVLERLQENTAAMPDVVGTAAQGLAEMRARAQDLKDRLGMALLPTLSTLLDTVGSLTDTVLPPLVDIFENSLVPALERGAEFVQGFVLRITNGQGPLEAIKNTLYDMGLSDVAEQFGILAAKVQEVIDQVAPYVEQAATWIGQNVELKDVLIALGVAIAAFVIPVIASIVSSVAPVIAVFLAAVAIVALMRQAWESNFLGIRDKTQAALEFIRNLISSVLSWIQGFWAAHGEQISAVAERAWTMIRTLFDAFRAAFSGDWQGFGEKLREWWDMAWENLKNVVKAAFDWFKSVDWGEVGNAIVRGIASGIEAAVGWLVDAAKSVANAALEAAKGFLGIHSPSAVFAKIGEQMMAGMAKGILDAASLAEDAVARATGAMPAVALGGGGGTAQVATYNVTINSIQPSEDIIADIGLLQALGV